MQPPINTIKHIVQRPNTTVTTGTTTSLDIIDAVVAPATGTTFEVREGAVIKAVWVEIWISNAGPSGQSNQLVITVEKLPSGLIPPTNPNMLNLGAYPNKKNILQIFQGLETASVDGNGQMAPLRGWFKIPKGKQRFGLGDKLIYSVATVSQNSQTCGVFIYKEYF